MSDKNQIHECPACGKTFDRKVQLRGHINSPHTECSTFDGNERTDSLDFDSASNSTQADDTGLDTVSSGCPQTVGDGGSEKGSSTDDCTSNEEIDLSDPAYYLSRELSKLNFNDRVLYEAIDDTNPLLERVKFLSIVTRNLDEFFMKRVGGLEQQRAANVTTKSPDGRTPTQHLSEVRDRAEPLMQKQARCYHDQLRPALAEEGIEILDYDDLTAAEQETLDKQFRSSVLPTLTPLTIDSTKPFPHISNLSLSLGVLTQQAEREEPIFSRIKIPRNQSRLVQIADQSRFVLLEDLVAANLKQLFPDVDILEHATFRVTRNAEVRRNEEVAEDLLQRTEAVLEQRRFATVVRLEIEKTMSSRMMEPLLTNLDVSPTEVIHLPPPLDFRDFDSLLELDRPELKVEAWTPQPHPRLSTRHGEDRPIFEEIKRGDVLVHHPYHSFSGTVQRFLDEAARDPKVLAIKATIYRTASDSKVIQRLIEAAENGKQVAVMVELKARFDEQNNLEWAKKLEEEGIHVAYGTIGYKTHTKTTLIVRKEADGVQLYSHIGTGNYHHETAKRYEDLGLFTADRDTGQDLVKLFNYFTGHSLHSEYRELLVAPGNMRERFVELIRREIDHARDGKKARIVAKMNRLEDPAIVQMLYRASRAGVDIDLIVRDICRLRPGVEGISDRISVVSIVNRFLEHSRIVYFHNAGDSEYYIGSADWMERNLDNRVEAVTPIHDQTLQQYLQHVLELCLIDNSKAWEMKPDGSYVQRDPDDEPVRNAQETLMNETTGPHSQERS